MSRSVAGRYGANGELGDTTVYSGNCLLCAPLFRPNSLRTQKLAASERGAVKIRVSRKIPATNPEIRQLAKPLHINHLSQ